MRAMTYQWMPRTLGSDLGSMLPLVWRPALATMLRVALGVGIGVALGAVCGNVGFWAAIGCGLGGALECLDRRA